jgi:hypothetical protein
LIRSNNDDATFAGIQASFAFRCSCAHCPSSSGAPGRKAASLLRREASVEDAFKEAGVTGLFLSMQ